MSELKQSLSQAPLRTLTELDHIRILNLVRRNLQAGTIDSDSPIELALDDADLVPSQDIAANIVTMYSQILLRDSTGGESRKLTLCYPPDVDLKAGFISVLSPLGASLLGLQVGQRAQWLGPDGSQHTAEVLEILFQPEASGDYLL